MTEPQSPRPEVCCHDGALTDEPVVVDEVHTASGAGANVFACPTHAPLYPKRGVEPRLGVEHF